MPGIGQKMKINIIGDTVGHHRKLSQYLWERGVVNHFEGQPFSAYDITFVMGANHLHAEHLAEGNPPVVVFATGTDIFKLYGMGNTERKKEHLKKCALVLYVHKRAMDITGVKGKRWQIPYDDNLFYLRLPLPESQMRGTLIYCPKPDKYRLKDVLWYIVGHPEQTFTILGEATIALIACPPNTELVRYTENLPDLMARHKKLMFWVTDEEMPDHPKINVIGCEALAMKLKVYVNGKQYYYLPKYMDKKIALDELLEILENVADKHGR